MTTTTLLVHVIRTSIALHWLGLQLKIRWEKARYVFYSKKANLDYYIKTNGFFFVGAGNLEIIVAVNGKNVPNYVQSEGNARFKVCSETAFVCLNGLYSNS